MKARTPRVAFAVGAVALASVLPVTVSSAQQSDPTATCSGSTAVVPFPRAGFGFAGPAAVFSGANRRGSITVSASLPAGTYEVNTTAYDGYVDRSSTPTQEFEQFVLQFLDVNGGVLATTGATPDLADGVEEASWNGSVGQVVLGDAVTSVRAVHAYAGVDGISPNSVQPACFGVSEITTATTTTTTTTSTPPVSSSTTTTTTTTPASTSTTTTTPTSSSSTTTTAAPTTTTTVTPTTTTTIVVAPPVQESPPAEPTTGTPTFTG